MPFTLLPAPPDSKSYLHLWSAALKWRTYATPYSDCWILLKKLHMRNFVGNRYQNIDLGGGKLRLSEMEICTYQSNHSCFLPAG